MVKAELYIADRFDTLASGKMVALGLYADRVVVIQAGAEAPPPSADAPYGLQLDLLLAISGLSDAPLEASLQITLPGGAAAPPMALGTVQAPSGRSLNLVVQLQPLLVPEIGVYRAEFTVGDESAPLQFEVRVNTGAATASDGGQLPEPSSKKPRRRRIKQA